MGREQQAAGAALERDLDAFHVSLVGWYVQRNYPRDRRSKGAPDYTALGDGCPVLFDAKSSQGVTWSLHLLKPHQAQALDAWHAAGGLAGIYVRLADGDMWIMWRDIRARWRRWYVSGKADRLTIMDGVIVHGCDWTQALT